MEEPSKLPLKRVEFSLTKFNDVAIPHHLDLLRQHKANILKYEEAGMWARVRSEQTHAARVASQLRGLLAQLDALRTQVQPQDHTRFDALTQRARDSTLRAIVDYLGIIESSCRAIMSAAQDQMSETSPLSINRSASCERDASPSGAPVGSVGAVSTDSVGVVAHATAAPDLLQLQVDEQELSLRERAAVLEGWCSLQSEVRALHSVWHSLHSTACAQRDAVTHADSNVTVAADNVQAARSHLSSAEKFRLSAAGAGGAALGALLGGPVGLLVGAKVYRHTYRRVRRPCWRARRPGTGPPHCSAAGDGRTLRARTRPQTRTHARTRRNNSGGASALKRRHFTTRPLNDTADDCV